MPVTRELNVGMIKYAIDNREFRVEDMFSPSVLEDGKKKAGVSASACLSTPVFYRVHRTVPTAYTTSDGKVIAGYLP